MRSLCISVMAVVFFVVAPIAVDNNILFQQSVYAQDDWKKEFDDICVKTNESMNLSDEELRSLVARAEKLVPAIEKLDETQRKVYLRRLQKCRDLLSFVLESRKKS